MGNKADRFFGFIAFGRRQKPIDVAVLIYSYLGQMHVRQFFFQHVRQCELTAGAWNVFLVVFGCRMAGNVV